MGLHVFPCRQILYHLSYQGSPHLCIWTRKSLKAGLLSQRVCAFKTLIPIVVSFILLDYMHGL